MTKQEEQFWEYYNRIEEVALKHEVSLYTIVNFRQIFDYAYAAGKADGVSEVAAIVSGTK